MEIKTDEKVQCINCGWTGYESELSLYDTGGDDDYGCPECESTIEIRYEDGSAWNN